MPPSNRRTFLTRSALASGALVLGAAPGCGAAPAWSTLGIDEGELLARLERGLERVRGVPRGEIAQHLTWLARPMLSEMVLRQSLEALVVADVARSLPEGRAVPEPLAQRLIDELPVLGRSIHTHHALLSRMPAHAMSRLQTRLRADPEAPMEIADWLDRHARELGTAADSRMKLRLAARHVKVRMHRQSVSAVIHDCVAKVERVAMRSGGALGLSKGPSMIATIWQDLDGITSGPGQGSSLPSLQASTTDVDDAEWQAFMAQPNPLWSASWGRPGDEEVEVGAIMMPFGLVTCGLLLFTGLITLLVGVVQNETWDGTARDP